MKKVKKKVKQSVASQKVQLAEGNKDVQSEFKSIAIQVEQAVEEVK